MRCGLNSVDVLIEDNLLLSTCAGCAAWLGRRGIEVGGRGLLAGVQGEVNLWVGDLCLWCLFIGCDFGKC
jgi:hypothetical protein